MRTIILGLAGAAALLAETWSGNIVDVHCKANDLASHTRDCAVMCAKGGYGIALSDGKFMKFDEKGNAKTLAALKASKKEKDLKGKVTGTLSGEVIKVDSVELE